MANETQQQTKDDTVPEPAASNSGKNVSYISNLRLFRTSDQLNGNGQINQKDSIEYRLLLTYSQRKGTAHSQIPPSREVGEANDALPAKPKDCHKPGKKKKHKFLKFISCIQPANDDDHSVTEKHRAKISEGTYKEDVDTIVNALTRITDSVHFSAEEIETDSDDALERIVELLREHGDKLNEQIEKNKHLQNKLQSLMSYSFFEQVLRVFRNRLSPEERPAAPRPQQAELALICEVTSRLNVVDNHPMNRVLGFGTRYLQDHFTPWVNRHGGYGKLFCTDMKEEEEEEDVH